MEEYKGFERKKIKKNTKILQERRKIMPIIYFFLARAVVFGLWAATAMAGSTRAGRNEVKAYHYPVTAFAFGVLFPVPVSATVTFGLKLAQEASMRESFLSGNLFLTDQINGAFSPALVTFLLIAVSDCVFWFSVREIILCRVRAKAKKEGTKEG